MQASHDTASQWHILLLANKTQEGQGTLHREPALKFIPVNYIV